MLFKKKTEGINFKKYTLKLNLRSICLFEKLRGKSFFEFDEMTDDIEYLLYSSLVSSNDIIMDFKTFKIVIVENKKFAGWLAYQYGKIASFTSQFKSIDNNEEASSGETKDNMKVIDIAASLIINYNMNPYYVYNDMQLWEMEYQKK